MLTLFRSLFAAPRHLILVVTAVWIGSWLAERRAARHGLTPNDVNNLTFYPLLGYILGGRILFALEHLPAFAADPHGLLSLNFDLFDPLGGLAAALLIALVYGQRRGLSLWPTLDALTPLFAVLLIGIALSHLALGSAFGRETSLPWGIDLWGMRRHPSQLYELLASSLTLGLLLFPKANSRSGHLFLTFAALTSGWMLFLEAFRGDSALVLGGLRLKQILAWLVLALTLFLLDRMSTAQPPDPKGQDGFQ
ncbi:MAG: prolipoprotein diacylglyceryl transferase [Anaerolineales bacterium]